MSDSLQIHWGSMPATSGAPVITPEALGIATVYSDPIDMDGRSLLCTGYDSSDGMVATPSVQRHPMPYNMVRKWGTALAGLWDDVPGGEITITPIAANNNGCQSFSARGAGTLRIKLVVGTAGDLFFCTYAKAR